MSFNTYGQKQKSGTARVQVWAEVNGVKTGGGTLDVSALPTGTVFPAGMPVGLDKSGGTLTPIYFYELAKKPGASDKVATLVGAKALPKSGNIKAPGEGGATVAYTAVKDNENGTFEVTIAAGAFSAFEAGAVFQVENAEAVEPAGLLWHDIVVEKGDTLATGAVVDEGRIYEDRIIAIPAEVKKALPGIKFEKGV